MSLVTDWLVQCLLTSSHCASENVSVESENGQLCRMHDEAHGYRLSPNPAVPTHLAAPQPEGLPALSALSSSIYTLHQNNPEQVVFPPHETEAFMKEKPTTSDNWAGIHKSGRKVFFCLPLRPRCRKRHYDIVRLLAAMACEWRAVSIAICDIL